MLSDPPSEELAVERLLWHFDKQVQLAIVSHGIRTIDQLITMLDSLDQVGDLKSNFGIAKGNDLDGRSNFSPLKGDTDRHRELSQGYTPSRFNQSRSGNPGATSSPQPFRRDERPYRPCETTPSHS